MMRSIRILSPSLILLVGACGDDGNDDTGASSTYSTTAPTTSVGTSSTTGTTTGTTGDTSSSTSTTTATTGTSTTTGTTTTTGTSTSTDTSSTTTSTTTSTDTSTTTSTDTSTTTSTDTSTTTDTSTSGTDTSTSTTTTTSTTGETDTGVDGDPASGITLTDLEFNQGVAIPMATDGMVLDAGERETAGNQLLDVTKGRGGLFRAYYELEGGWMAREIQAVLTLQHEGGATETLIDTRMISGAPDGEDVDGTFRWLLEGDQIQPGTNYKVELFETGTGGTPPAQPPRLPADGSFADMGVPDLDLRLDLMFVPCTMSGQTPNLSADNVEKLTEGYFDMNPIAEITVEVHDPINVSGSDIGSVLDAINMLRSQENPPADLYYVGFAPVAVTGWSGVANLPGRGAATPMSETVNFPSENSVGFAVHETGHNQGIHHNPGCGAQTQNPPPWPYGSSTKINTQGYGVRSGDLYGAQEFEDYMNYCVPDWPSAFTWNRSLDNLAIPSPRQPVDFSHHMIHGSFQGQGQRPQWWTSHLRPLGLFDAKPVQIQLELHDGSTMTIAGVEQKYPDIDGSYIEAVLPVAPSKIKAATVRSAGGFKFKVTALDLAPKDLTAPLP